ncbi:UDP-N-acetylmuramoyl-L-alanine--D-glutamate ligase [Olsenella sp. An285]|uniref:UDP-N-acetylmuramoyl-L-alanine--D-glutamate ligase n=1 Tax=Olsenella sp. An285 TaxID=1965621 RepID=UPI000B379098|nr:UDP-N-acetylmuramoyl-L-alanine--D-glutamate ligase [Olsenella sp. An285]OUO46255.1 UDP-N-acetylmuramoyl-L-alanine--D-glutamate ligase [Olsenella sp. An285]
MASQAYLGNTLVLGLGRTGESAARYLASLGPDRVASVTLYGGASSEEGERTRALEDAGVSVTCGTEDVTGSFDLAVASPGIPMDAAFFRAAEACSREVVSEPELAWRESPERWVAITGTNGKTTTTSLATHLLREGGLAAESVGNIGTPPTEAVPSRAEGGWLVAELSSFQLAETRLFAPRVAVLLNVTPDHLEWHHTMEAYAAAKERAFANLGEGDLAVVSVDDSWCRAVAERCEARGVRTCRLSVAGDPGSPCAAFLREGALVVRLDGAEHELVPASELRIFGLHNAENALAAAAVALEVGVAEKDVRSGLRSFSPIEHRIEPAGTVGGVSFVNDSKATNTDSVEKALTAFPPGTIVLMLGGHDKMTDLASLAAAVCERCRVAVCFGAAGERIASALEQARLETGAALEVDRAPHLREAFDAAVAAARPGETVLLSPACSSFDEFSNMAERGRLFKELVRGLSGTGE